MSRKRAARDKPRCCHAPVRRNERIRSAVTTETRDAQPLQPINARRRALARCRMTDHGLRSVGALGSFAPRTRLRIVPSSNGQSPRHTARDLLDKLRDPALARLLVEALIPTRSVSESVAASPAGASTSPDANGLLLRNR